MDYVGKVFPSFFRYRNSKSGEVGIKVRPSMIVGVPDNPFDKEFLVLPVSTMVKQEFINPEYDVYISPNEFPKCSFNRPCYIRCHKRTVIYKTEFDFRKCIADIKNDYPEVFEDIMSRMHKYDEYIYKNRY